MRTIFALALLVIFLSACSTENVQDRTGVVQTDLYGTMLGLNPNNGLGVERLHEKIEDLDWKEFYATYGDAFLSGIASTTKDNIEMIQETGFSSNRDLVGYFTWNVIQAEKDAAYAWDVPDAGMKLAADAGVSYSAVVQPYAAWHNPIALDPSTCFGIDFEYVDYKKGDITDWDAYTAWLSALVERYDGDGVDDMPELETKVSAWEIGNEVEGPCLALEVEYYIELLKVSYETIKAADPSALVLNAGALQIQEVNGYVHEDVQDFWRAFFAGGGAAYIDAFNLHYNLERAEDVQDSSLYEDQLEFYRGLMAGEKKPIWITEFGKYTGRFEMERNDGVALLPEVTEEQQAAWVFRYSIIGFSYGVEKIFFDLMAGADDALASSALFDQEGNARKQLTTTQTIAEKLEGFESVEKLAEGQYMFDVDGKTVYALWEGNLPLEISGIVTATDYLGHEETVDASEVVYSEENPVFAEMP